MSTDSPRGAVSIVELVRLFSDLRKKIPLDELVALVGDLSPFPTSAEAVDAYVDRIAPHLATIAKAGLKWRFTTAPAHVVGAAAWAVPCEDATPDQWSAALDAAIDAGEVAANERAAFLSIFATFAQIAAQVLPLILPYLL